MSKKNLFSNYTFSFPLTNFPTTNEFTSPPSRPSLKQETQPLQIFSRTATNVDRKSLFYQSKQKVSKLCHIVTEEKCHMSLPLCERIARLFYFTQSYWVGRSMSLLCVEWVLQRVWLYGYNFFLLYLMFPRKPHIDSNRTLSHKAECEKCAVKCFFNGNNREEDKKILRNTRMKFKDLLLKITADLHFFDSGILCVVFCFYRKKKTQAKLHAQ